MRIANDNDILVCNLYIGFSHSGNDKREVSEGRRFDFGRDFVYYSSRNEHINSNDELKMGRLGYYSYNIYHRDDIVEYNAIPTYDEDVAASVERFSNMLSITKISTSKPNSADGVDVSITWQNNSDKEIKYITICVEAYNAVGDYVECEIRDTSLYNVEITGPIESGKTITTRERNAWYNKNIVKAELYDVEIRYMDDSREVIIHSDIGLSAWPEQ